MREQKDQKIEKIKKTEEKSYELVELENLTKEQLVELSLQEEVMRKYKKSSYVQTEEEKTNCKIVEKIFKFAKKFRSNIRERALSQTCVNLLKNFIKITEGKDKSGRVKYFIRYDINDLSNDQIKKVKKIFNIRKELETVCTPQVGKDGTIYCYHEGKCDNYSEK